MIKVSAKLICGSTKTTDGHAEAQGTYDIQAQGIAHTAVPALLDAAPELLEACEYCQSVLDSLMECDPVKVAPSDRAMTRLALLDMLESALAKVKGGAS